MTETAPISVNVMEDDSDGCVGQVAPGLEVRIADFDDFDDKNKSKLNNSIGEVIVKNLKVCDESIVHTGDLGFINSSGNLCLVGRLKDIIIVNGFNVSPSSVENTLLRHENVKECVVYGIPCKRKGEAIVAFVIYRGLEQNNQQELLSFCSQYLSDYSIPEIFIMVESFPLSASGKIDKEKLLELI